MAEIFGSPSPKALNLIFGACGDKDVDEVLRILAPFVCRAFAVRTNNPRSLAADALAARMRAVGLDATPCRSLSDAFAATRSHPPSLIPHLSTLICGSLFLAGEALVALNAYPWPATRVDPSELLTRHSV